MNLTVNCVWVSTHMRVALNPKQRTTILAKKYVVALYVLPEHHAIIMYSEISIHSSPILAASICIIGKKREKSITVLIKVPSEVIHGKS